jgi:hypothetical protein
VSGNLVYADGKICSEVIGMRIEFDR